ncbi:MAG: hypothetical protein ACR2OH_00815 [Microthrixaceae bacterium]
MAMSSRRTRARMGFGALALVTVLLFAACAPSYSGGGGTGPTVTAVPPHNGFMMIANRAGGFFSLPWPNDIRKLPTGTIDMRGLPGLARNPLVDPIPPVPFLAQSVSKAAASITDFGTNTAVYFQANADVDASSLPTTADASLTASATAMLINLDDGYSRHPVLAVYEPTGDRYSPNRLLSLVPYPGHPLDPATNYAAVVFNGVLDTVGTPLDPAPLISQLDGAWDDTRGVDEPTWTALQAQKADVSAAVSASTSWDPADVVAFSVYRTQDTTVEIDAIAAAHAALPTPTLTVESQDPCAVDPTGGGGGATNSLLTGTLSVPDFQIGYYPYLESGGAIDVVGGVAELKKQRDVPVRMRVPCGTAPGAGWPSVAHLGHIDSEGDSDANPPPYSYDGYVFAEIPAHMAGATSSTLSGVGIAAADQPGLLYANFINPNAGRANPLQQASDHISLLRALEAFSIDGATVGTTGTVETDDTASVASGHSQGAWSLPLVAKATTGLEAVYSSSGSGGQYHSLAHTFQRNSLALFTADDVPLDELNPLVQLVQATTEVSDGINVDADDLPAGLHYVNVTGANDGCVALEASRHFSTALGLDLANKQYPSSFYGSPLLDPAETTLPASGNGAGGGTRVQLETAGGHEQALVNSGLGTDFLTDVAAGVAPTVPDQAYSNSYYVCGYRYDYLGGDPFGRV